MDMYEFGKACQPLNKKYRELFGYIPHHDDFPCSREEYVDALGRAIIEKKEVFYFLPGLSGKAAESSEQGGK